MGIASLHPSYALRAVRGLKGLRLEGLHFTRRTDFPMVISAARFDGLDPNQIEEVAILPGRHSGELYQ